MEKNKISPLTFYLLSAADIAFNHAKINNLIIERTWYIRGGVKLNNPDYNKVQQSSFGSLRQPMDAAG